MAAVLAADVRASVAELGQARRDVPGPLRRVGPALRCANLRGVWARSIHSSGYTTGFSRAAWFELDFMSGKRVWDCDYIIRQAFRNGNLGRHEWEAKLLEREKELRKNAEAGAQSLQRDGDLAAWSHSESKRSGYLDFRAIQRDALRALQESEQALRRY